MSKNRFCTDVYRVGDVGAEYHKGGANIAKLKYLHAFVAHRAKIK